MNPFTRLPKLKPREVKRDRVKRLEKNTKMTSKTLKLARKKHEKLGTTRDGKKVKRKEVKAKIKARGGGKGPARKKQRKQ